MKTFLNRRPSVLANGPSHLVAIARATSESAAASDLAEMPAMLDGDASPTADMGASALPRAVPTLRAVPVVPAQVNGRPVQIAEGSAYERLALAGALTTFRSFSSFDFAVCLQYHSQELTFYVALHQDGALWRVLKAVDLDTASAAFHHLEEQATRLADGETRRAQLIAQNAQLVRQIEESETQAEQLRGDLQRHAAQEHAVANRQHQIRKEVAQLEAQRIAAQAQLNKTHRALHQLALTHNEGVPHLSGR